jgi:hypothetical protein
MFLYSRSSFEFARYSLKILQPHHQSENRFGYEAGYAANGYKTLAKIQG